MNKVTLGLLVVACGLLTGCGAINAYTAAGLNQGGADYIGARTNLQKVDDDAFLLWSDSACNIKLGALKRNATGNNNAVPAALLACPIPNPVKTLQTQPSLSPKAPVDGVPSGQADVLSQPLP